MIELMQRLMFAANVGLAGWISLTCMFSPEKARLSVFEGTIAYSESIRLVGCLWFGIFVLSMVGVCFPQKMNLVFLFQLIYKGTWLVVAAWPLIQKDLPYPRGMATCFLVWVVLLPFVIDWEALVS